MKMVRENNICVEVYQEELPGFEEIEQEKNKALNQLKDKLQNLQKLGERYRELGLLCQSAKVGEKIKAIKAEEMSKIFDPKAWGYHEITSEEMKIWEIWLPSRYAGNGLLIYSFDQIPATVLTAWEAAKAFGIFQNFTIRTPETKKTQDPILIGYLKDVPYLIARWGESLRPFEEIKGIVEKSLSFRFKFFRSKKFLDKHRLPIQK